MTDCTKLAVPRNHKTLQIFKLEYEIYMTLLAFPLESSLMFFLNVMLFLKYCSVITQSNKISIKYVMHFKMKYYSTIKHMKFISKSSKNW